MKTLKNSHLDKLSYWFQTPASIGPIHIPDNFEIAVIDTAPGGFNLFRTTGPFYAQRGDVWEVEIPNEDEKSPELFFRKNKTKLLKTFIK